LVERVRLRRDVEHLVQQHVRLQRPHEQQRRCARVFDADAPRLGGAAEVIGHDDEPPPRRRVLVAHVERQDD
jgi:hypothetical protein